MEFRIRVGCEAEGCKAAVRHLDSQFLPKFPNDRRLRSLAGVNLPARELPQPCEHPALGPPRNQHPPVAVHEGAGGNQAKISFGNRR